MESLLQYIGVALNGSADLCQPLPSMVDEPEVEDDGDRVALEARMVEERRTLAA
jgi:hypothetical protein